MSYLSGAPCYNYELCRELKKQGHKISMMSEWRGGLTGVEGHKLRENFEVEGIKLLSWDDSLNEKDYDLIIASEDISQKVLDQCPNVPAINVVHSEYVYETPIPNRDQIIVYVCVRYMVLEHITKEHGIPLNKCAVIYNGVDRERFKPRPKQKRDYYKIVVPCTLDTLREPFLNKLIDSANEKRRIFIYGIDCGAKLHKNEWTYIFPDKFNIEEDIADADEVAGILLGRVQLESWSCEVNSSIYDPNTLEYQLFPPPIDFDQKYNIVNVATQILSLIENLDNLTIVIPHYDSTDLLKDLLDDLMGVKNIVVSKGGSFAESSNQGFKAVDTEFVVFLNDDVRIKGLHIFRSMITALKSGADIVGCLPDNGCRGFNIENGTVYEVIAKDTIPQYPSGFCLMMRTETYRKLDGFSLEFINGCDDIDFLLRANEQGLKIRVLSDVIHHEVGKSLGRYDNVKRNVELFNKIWKDKYKILAI